MILSLSCQEQQKHDGFLTKNAVDALRRSIVSVKIVLEQESAFGNATALGLSIHLKTPTFIATLLVLSDILSVYGNLSRCLQSNSLNLLSVEDLVRDCKSALNELKEYPFTRWLL